MAKKKARVDSPRKPDADDKILEEARERFKRCEEWESDCRNRYLEDTKFVHGDSDNNWQWPQDARTGREAEKRPMLTVNKTRQYCLNITNDAKQNKPSIEVRPVGNRATVKGSDVMEGIIRHIEYQSNAQTAYDNGTMCQVHGGWGYWRVTTDYADGETFDQEIYIRPVKNPLNVYLDPDIQEFDGSDARFGFIFDDMPIDKFDQEYPDWKDKIGDRSTGAKNVIAEMKDWLDEHHVRVCEYYRVKVKRYKLILMVDPQTKKTGFVRSDKLDRKILEPLMEAKDTKWRWAEEKTVEWFKIAGDEIIDRTVWAGSTVPIVRIIGEEIIVDGKLDRKGHVRNLKDPQRIYNYWTSCGVEFVALQNKIPYVAPARAIEGLEDYWATANLANHSVLPYNDVDDEGKEIKAPVRQEPPVMATAYVQGLAIAEQEMRMSSGQYQAELGEKSNEKSGVAIYRRQRQGDLATYHYQDHRSIAVQYTGRIILELIPKIYDTTRVIKILGEDGKESDVTVDPAAQQEYLEEQTKVQDKVKIIFNPGFAKYAAQSDVGPSYATRREEAFQAFTQIIGQNMDLIKVAGDLMFKAADFPMADELAERLKKMVPSYILGKGPSPEVQQLTALNQQLMKHIQDMMQNYQEERTKRISTDANKDIEAFNAETTRLKVLLDKFDPNQIAEFTAQLVLQALGEDVKVTPPKAKKEDKPEKKDKD